MNPTKVYTIAEKISELTRCLKWFVGMLILNVLTFWVPLVWSAAKPAVENIATWIIVIGSVLVGALAIFFINKLVRVIKCNDVWLYYLVPVLFPLTAPVALLLLCQKTIVSSSKLGHRIELVSPRVRGGLSSATFVTLGAVIVWAQCSDMRNHALLQKRGQQITGTLQMVTKHYVYFIPSGYSFLVKYAGTFKDFWVGKQFYLENTLPDGKFIQHPIAVVYLPENPSVADLPENLKVSAFSPFAFLIGGLFICAGGWGFYLVIANKLWFTDKGGGVTGQLQNTRSKPI